MGRPRRTFDVLDVLRLRLEGLSWPSIARRTGLGLGTVYRAYRTAIDSLQPFQNPKAARIRRRDDLAHNSETDRHDLHDVHTVSTGIEESAVMLALLRSGALIEQGAKVAQK